MKSRFSKSSPVAERYVGALIDLAAEKGALDNIASDFSDLGGMLESSSDFRRLVESPLINEAARERAIRALCDKAGFHELSVNFLLVLVHNGRLNHLPDMMATFKTKLAKHRGEIDVSVQTAQDLNDKQRESLKKTLAKVTGSKVTLSEEVSKDLLGGMVVTVGSVMVDDSVAGKLSRLRAVMSQETQLQEAG